MRALVARKLTASGYSIGQKLKLRGVEVFCVMDPRGSSMLLIANVFYGPSWAQIHKCLEHLVPAPTLITLGSTPGVLISDSVKARAIIANLFDNANASRAKQVHLEGIGFVELDSKAKIEVKNIALPIVSIICVVGLGVFWGNNQEPSPSADVVPVIAGCIVDSSRYEFERWLIETLSSGAAMGPGQEIQRITAMGQLNIVVESTIGSAAKVTGEAVCDDGRKRPINHRVDSSGSGAVLELGQ